MFNKPAARAWRRPFNGSSLATGLAMAVAALVIGAMLPTAPTRADQITLTDGRVIQGSLQRENGKYLISPDDGAPFIVGLDQVSGIVLGASPNTPQYEHQQWRALEGQLNRVDKPDDAIKLLLRYQKQYPHSPDAKDVASSLAKFHRIKRLGLVKFAGKWVTPAGRQAIESSLEVQVANADKLLRSGDLQSASKVADAVLKADTENLGALLVGGVAQYRMNQLVKSAQFLHRAVKIAPTDAIAWNDLAVVSYQQKQQPQSLNYYTRAIHLASSNRLLLDNVAAAMHFYRHSRSSFLYTNLEHIFTRADTRMQIKMASQGLYRYGDGWITRKQHAKIAGAHSHYQTQKLTLEAQYAGATTRLASVEKQIKDANDRINEITAEIVNLELAQQALLAQAGVINVTNQAILQADIAQLNNQKAVLAQLINDRNNLIAAIEQMRVEAAQMSKNPPRDGYLGLQQMMLPGDLTNPPPPLPFLLPIKAAPAQAGLAPARRPRIARNIPGVGANQNSLMTQPGAYGIYDQPVYFGSYVFLGYPFIYFPRHCHGHPLPSSGSINFHNPFSPGVIQNGGPGVIQTGPFSGKQTKTTGR